MSRVAKNPIAITTGVQVTVGKTILVKGSKGELSFEKSNMVVIEHKENTLYFSVDEKIKESKKIVRAWEMAGTTRAIVNNMIKGVSEGFVKTLVLVGVGYRAKLQGKDLVLTLGYSHDITYKIPDDIDVEVPSQTEISIKGKDKQRVGQIAAEIRSFRSPEPYKGKGVLYKDENLVRKEVRKKT